jgi:hypothetical protein
MASFALSRFREKILVLALTNDESSLVVAFALHELEVCVITEVFWDGDRVLDARIVLASACNSQSSAHTAPSIRPPGRRPKRYQWAKACSPADPIFHDPKLFNAFAAVCTY